LLILQSLKIFNLSFLMHKQKLIMENKDPLQGASTPSCWIATRCMPDPAYGTPDGHRMATGHLPAFPPRRCGYVPRTSDHDPWGHGATWHSADRYRARYRPVTPSPSPTTGPAAVSDDGHPQRRRAELLVGAIVMGGGEAGHPRSAAFVHPSGDQVPECNQAVEVHCRDGIGGHGREHLCRLQIGQGA